MTHTQIVVLKILVEMIAGEGKSLEEVAKATFGREPTAPSLHLYGPSKQGGPPAAYGPCHSRGLGALRWPEDAKEAGVGLQLVCA